MLLKSIRSNQTSANLLFKNSLFNFVFKKGGFPFKPKKATVEKISEEASKIIKQVVKKSKIPKVHEAKLVEESVETTAIEPTKKVARVVKKAAPAKAKKEVKPKVTKETVPKAKSHKTKQTKKEENHKSSTSSQSGKSGVEDNTEKPRLTPNQNKALKQIKEYEAKIAELKKSANLI